MADVNARTIEDTTPLHVAAAGNHPEIVSELCYGGGDVNLQNSRGWTPLHAASQAGQKFKIN